MMYIFLVCFLPLAYGFATLEDYPCYEFEDPVCTEPYDMLCPSSVDFYTGCPYGPGTCHESVQTWYSDNEGNPCPNYCPVECDWTMNEMYCPDAPINGCYGPGSCIAPAKDNFGGDCYAYCPPTCNYDYGEVYCPGGIDSWSGCEMPGYCAYSYYDNCPAVCDVSCDYGNGETMCHNGYDENGCDLGSYCMAPTMDKWNNTCYANCPPVCNAAYGEVFCPGGFDSYSGCEMPGYCAYPWSTECPAVCWPTCDYYNGEMYCDNGVDENGCSLGGYCAATCGTFNATATAGSCFEEDTVYKGEPLKDVNPIKDVESALDCQVQCQENPDCEYFTWNSGTGGGKWNKKNANTCWLKSTQGNIKMHCGKKCTGRTSGAKFC